MDIGGIGAGFGYVAHQPGRRAEGASLPDIDEMVERIVEARDQDGNGTLDGVELSISPEAFRRLDTNADDRLDTSELVEGAKKLLRQMGLGRGLARPMGVRQEDENDNEQTPLDLLFGDDKNEGTGIDLPL